MNSRKKIGQAPRAVEIGRIREEDIHPEAKQPGGKGRESSIEPRIGPRKDGHGQRDTAIALASQLVQLIADCSTRSLLFLPG